MHEQDTLADNLSTAWWIAFGPHGPRAETPPGEWGRVWAYTGIGVAVSAVLFLSVSTFARPPPRTMTKEWQEATNEYLKVSLGGVILTSALLISCRKKRSTRSTVSAAKVTRARATCRASLQRLKASVWRPRSRCVDCGSFPESHQQNFAGRTHGWLYACDTSISITVSITHVQKLNLIDCAILLIEHDVSFAI
jgi:hypothetical protein